MYEREDKRSRVRSAQSLQIHFTGEVSRPYSITHTVAIHKHRENHFYVTVENNYTHKYIHTKEQAAEIHAIYAMLLNIFSFAFCATLFIVEGQFVSRPRSCQRHYYGQSDLNYDLNKHCEVSSSDVTHESWYQEEALLQVIDGTFTVELLGYSSAPSSLNAERKGIVRLQKGFASIPSLERLSLEDNSIETIESYVFEGLPELVHLSLARNRISYLGDHCFRGLDKLEVLNLNYNSLMGDITFSTTRYHLPGLRQLYLQHNWFDDLRVFPKGHRRSFQLCHSNLKHLYVSNSSIESFSDGDSYCSNHLSHLFLEDNRLSSFSVGKMPLEALSLDGNRLTDFSNGNPELKFLSLARNFITEIAGFENFENIVYLTLSYNLISNRNFPVVWKNLSSLKYLALDYNFIRAIPDGFFSNLTSLKKLDLSGNMIENIDPQAFAHLPALQELHLNNIGLTSFPGKESFGKSNLAYLDLSNNRIEKISDLEVNMIPKLKVLKLTGNPLKIIEAGSVSSDVSILL